MTEERKSRKNGILCSAATVLRRKRWFCVSVLCQFVAILLVVWTRPVEGHLAQEGVPGAPQFHYLTANFPSMDRTESHVTVYIAVAHRQLQFRRINETFQAAYTVSIVARQRNREIAGIDWRRRIRVVDYASTRTFNEFDLSEGTLVLKPGRYRFLIELEDEETHKVGQAIRYLTVRDFSRGLKVSDVLFVGQRSPDSMGAGDIVFPELGHTEDLNAYFEVCAPDTEAVDIQWEVLGARGKVFIQGAYQRSIRMKPSIEIVPIPSDSLLPGQYLFQVQAKVGKRRDRSMRVFYVRHKGLIRPEENLDLVVEQLRYVASPTEWHRMMAASEEEKRALFEDFWKQRDPTPDTPENELMEEYYTRVAYANQRFSAGRAGWRTDRGAVYIIYGPPDTVRRRTLWDQIGQERSYEIWQYKEAARRFVFLYDPLLGDFRLVSSQ